MSMGSSPIQATRYRPLQVVFYLGGSGTILLAMASYLTAKDAPQLLQWLWKMFTPGFIGLFILLLFFGVYGILQLNGSRSDEFWQECAQQSANGIATLALTFTLLGISLGIGSLSHQEIDAQTVPILIQALTGHFSMAFMTTVVGLPTAAFIRALTSLRAIRLRNPGSQTSC